MRGYELLCGGPLDGLPVEAVDAPSYVPAQEVVMQHRLGNGARYIRRRDGRLHYEHSGWDAAQEG